MLAGSPKGAMEAAKKIIAGKVRIDPALLAEIASSRCYKKWSRIAAIYVLGLLNDKRCVPELIRVLENRKEDPSLRDHAAEALGNIRDRRAIIGLSKVLMSKENPRIKRSCIYALSEINATKARSILKQFEATDPQGSIRKVLQDVLY